MAKWWKKLFRRGRLEQDLAAELEFHREMAGANGGTIPLGDAGRIQEEVYDAWRFNAIENLCRDLTYAVRGLWKSKGLALSALLSLGLGIGVNTAIFSLAVEFLLSQPSIREAERVVYIRVAGGSHAEPRVVEEFDRSGVFDGVAGETDEPAINWNDGRETIPIVATQTTKNFFQVLGVPVALGRGWTASDPDDVVVLQHRFWMKHFHGDTGVLGKTMVLDGRVYTVLGVLPDGHRTLIGYGYSPDVYVPHFVKDAHLAMYARLKPGMGLGEGGAALATLSKRLSEQNADEKRYTNPGQMTPVGGFARLQQESKALTIAAFFGVLLLLVGLVLLIACVNVAGMLLARASARRQEIAIRLSLGATRGRLFQQLLAESVALAVAGTAVGFAMAMTLVKVLSAIPLPIPIPVRLHVEPDWRVVAYAAALAVVATLASGLAPAWQTVKDSLAADLHKERRLRLRRGLVVAQVAVSFVVLVTGALFLRSLMQSASLSPGFDIRNTARAAAHLPPGTYQEKGQMWAYSQRAVRELAALPGVEAAAAARIIPFNDATNNGTTATFPDTGEKRHIRYDWNAVTPDYFKTMSIPLVAGRAFIDSDGTGSKVVVANRVFARLFLAGRQAVGTRFSMDGGVYEIIGVVEGTKVMTMGEEAQPQLYEPLAGAADGRTKMNFVVKSATPPAGQLRAMRETLRRI
ncbi:MAG: ABC transporter permease, partial [Acidobacteriota bacterium]